MLFKQLMGVDAAGEFHCTGVVCGVPLRLRASCSALAAGGAPSSASKSGQAMNPCRSSHCCFLTPCRSSALRCLSCVLVPGFCRDQIVQWILQNTADSQAGGSAGQYVDPYTGASAYVPPAPSGRGAGGAGGSSSGGYGVTGGGADPFTGGVAARPLHLPAKSYLIYDQVTGTALVALAGRLHRHHQAAWQACGKDCRELPDGSLIRCLYGGTSRLRRPAIVNSRGLDGVGNTCCSTCPLQVPGREAIRKKIAELSAAVSAGGDEGAAAALSEAELADGGALDDLLSRQGLESGRKLDFLISFETSYPLLPPVAGTGCYAGQGASSPGPRASRNAVVTS